MGKYILSLSFNKEDAVSRQANRALSALYGLAAEHNEVIHHLSNPSDHQDFVTLECSEAFANAIGEAGIGVVSPSMAREPRVLNEGEYQKFLPVRVPQPAQSI